MQFQYEAKDSGGNLHTGRIVATDQEKAEAILADNNLTTVSLQVIQESILEKIWPFGRSVPGKEMVLFSRQLATLIGAQVPVLQALRILSTQVNNGYLKKILAEVITNVEAGDSLSLSISRYPKVFGNVYVNVIHSGELSGSMDKSLNYLADQLEEDYDLGSKVRGAMTYPIFVLSALFVIGGLMFYFVLPNLTSVLLSQGGQLPFVTVLLIGTSKFVRDFWWLIILGVFAIIFGIRYFINTQTGRYYWDRAKLSIPIIGGIFEKIYLARFSRNLATLVVGGIPIIKALEVVADLVNNVVYRDIILEAASRLATGKTISSALEGHKEIPNIVTQMIKVGEQSATLTDILNKLASYYEKEVDAKVASLTSLMEPLIMIVIGIAVGILVAGILLPIYNLASSSG